MENLSLYHSVLAKVKETAQVAGISELPEIIAVSKFQEAEKIITLYREGQRLFGENYVQELIEKKNLLESLHFFDIEFHFIGKLQTNKVKMLLPHVRTLHSVDSLKLLKEVEKQATVLAKKIYVYLQINLDGELSKAGFLPSQLPQFFCSSEWSLLKKSEWIQVIGWMTIPNPDLAAHLAFQQMKEISKAYQNEVGTKLSMGMSDDYVEAIREGATSLRIGSAIFGPRN